MENQYNNNLRGQWIAPQGQGQRFEGTPSSIPTIQQRPVMQSQIPQQKSTVQPPKKRPAPMPKARTLALLHTMKKWLVVSSLVGFGTFGGLIAHAQLSSTAAATASTTGTTTTTKSTTQSGNNFFQQGGTNIGTTTATPTATSTSTGSGSSTSTSTSNNTNTTSSAPVSGTSASPSH